MSASPKKSRRLLFMHLLETGIPSNEGFSLEELSGCLNEWFIRDVDTVKVAEFFVNS